ncbi:MAG TPA: acyl carrier protein [Pseudonocardiaceae bacterium]|nr:acyl carrier protein [Pseudonocardiaceae bacterium]
MTQRFTFTDLRSVVGECAGDIHALVESAADVEFTDLGFDSLAVYEIVTTLQQRFGIRIPDDDIDTMTTPARVIDYVNGRLVPSRPKGQ